MKVMYLVNQSIPVIPILLQWHQHSRQLLDSSFEDFGLELTHSTQKAANVPPLDEHSELLMSELQQSRAAYSSVNANNEQNKVTISVLKQQLLRLQAAKTSQNENFDSLKLSLKKSQEEHASLYRTYEVMKKQMEVQSSDIQRLSKKSDGLSTDLEKAKLPLCQHTMPLKMSFPPKISKLLITSVTSHN
jgi:chromosome segregation ATPase